MIDNNLVGIMRKYIFLAFMLLHSLSNASDEVWKGPFLIKELYTIYDYQRSKYVMGFNVEGNVLEGQVTCSHGVSLDSFYYGSISYDASDFMWSLLASAQAQNVRIMIHEDKNTSRCSSKYGTNVWGVKILKE